MTRNYNQDTWCVQKHLLLAGTHTLEGLQKIYRESPEHPCVPRLEKSYNDIAGLRHSFYDKWSNVAKQEQHGKEADCPRCVEDLGGGFKEVSSNNDMVVANNVVFTQNLNSANAHKKRFGGNSDDSSSKKESHILTKNKAVGGNNMADKFGMTQVLILDAGILLGAAGSATAEWAGRKLCARKTDPVEKAKCTPTDPAYVPSLTKPQNLIELGGGIALQVLGVWGGMRGKGAMKTISYVAAVAGGTMLANGIVRVAQERMAPTSAFYRSSTSRSGAAVANRNVYNTIRAMPYGNAGSSYTGNKY